MLDELQRVLSGRFGVPSDKVREALQLLRGHHVQNTPDKLIGPKVRDADDAWILAAAIAAGAEVLVTGDKDLLSVAADSPVRIVAPKGFLKMI